MARPLSPLPYMPQLDGLRALAVSAVLVHHLLDAAHLPDFLRHVSFGYLGVRLFFVLSGFLITGILLRSRASTEDGRTGLGHALRTFYARRFLRIFPLYYLVVALALLAGVPEAWSGWPWLLTYTYNFHILALHWYPEYFGHFWSLSVEEQFYVFWPLLILLAPRRALAPAIGATMALALLYRAWAASSLGGIAVYTFTLSSFDALGAGSLAALLAAGTVDRQRVSRVLLRCLLPVATLTAVATTVAFVFAIVGWAVFATVFEAAVALAFVALVWGAAGGFSGPIGALLALRPVVHLGRISYGVYVYHQFAPPLVRRGLERLGIELAERGPAEFAFTAAATVLVAAVSWHAFEAPIGRLKRRFRIDAGARRETPRA